MGRIDKTSKLFYDKASNYLSVINLLCPDEKLSARNLQEISENLLVMIERLMEGKEKQKKKKMILERYRDVVKKIRFGKSGIIVGIENQRYMDFSEPARVMLYDAMEYERQRKFIQWVHEEKKDLREDEFVAGFSKKDRLIPVVTIVIYYGKKPWKLPKKLSDIQKKSSGLEKLKEQVQDYNVNVIDVRRLTDAQIEAINSDVKLLFGYVKYDGNPKKLRAFIQKNRKRFERLSQETYEMIAIMTESGKLLEIMEKVKETGGYNMCKAIDEMVKEGEKRGIEQGRKQGIEQGMEQGRKQGESRLGLLISHLFADGRADDARKAAADERIRKEFYREYGIAE